MTLLNWPIDRQSCDSHSSHIDTLTADTQQFTATTKNSHEYPEHDFETIQSTPEITQTVQKHAIWGTWQDPVHDAKYVTNLGPVLPNPASLTSDTHPRGNDEKKLYEVLWKRIIYNNIYISTTYKNET